jgi:hypothetical protein
MMSNLASTLNIFSFSSSRLLVFYYIYCLWNVLPTYRPRDAVFCILPSLFFPFYRFVFLAVPHVHDSKRLTQSLIFDSFDFSKWILRFYNSCQRILYYYVLNFSPCSSKSHKKRIAFSFVRCKYLHYSQAAVSTASEDTIIMLSRPTCNII